MSGHSKWSKIKHQKAVTDVKKGKIFSKISRLITIAAKRGGDPCTNPSLRAVLEKAKAANMPSANVEKAIKKGTGELEGEKLEELVYEAYGPAGSAFIIQCITDNKNRAVTEIKKALNKHNARFGESGTVAWMFDTKGVIEVNIAGKNIEELELLAINAGAADILKEDDILKIFTKPEELHTVKEELEKAGITIESAELDLIAKNPIEITDKKVQEQIEKIIDALDELDDVQEIYTNIL